MEDEIVIPDAGIVKCENGSFSVIKFVIEDDTFVAYTTEIAQEDLTDIEEVNDIDEFSILFVKISYEFHYDEDNGIMEMQLSRLVTLTDDNTGESITSQEVIENSPEDLIPVYLAVIKSL